MPDFSIAVVFNHRGISETKTVESPAALADAVEMMIRNLPTDQRDTARKLVARRMNHPEGRALDTATDVHPKSTGKCWSTDVGARRSDECGQCGATLAAHDSGRRDVCDRFCR